MKKEIHWIFEWN